MPCYKTNNHYDNSDQKNEYRNSVHSVHQENIDIARCVWIFLAQVEITENLPPHIIKYYFTKDTNKTGGFLKEPVIFAIPKQGELAHLVERLHGMQEVTGSIPVFSTAFSTASQID